jgi:DNA integrity scanning protein DisA with diadenylate cyclase activity
MEAPSWTELLDIALVAGAFYLAIVWLRTAKAGRATLGALTIGAIYLAALELRLQLTAWIFQAFLAVFVLALVVVLQNDFRRLFERASQWSWRRRRAQGAETAKIIGETVFEMALMRCGALLVLPGRDLVGRHIDCAEPLDGLLTRPLLLSLFDPGSVGHDGAAIIDGDRVASFAGHLPLSTNVDEIGARGTRHSAALGLSEATDALVIVVSEERGEVAIARHAKIRRIESAEELENELLRFSGKNATEVKWPGRLGSGIRQRWANAVVALLLSVGMWQLFVAGSKAGQKTLTVPVLVENIDPAYQVDSIEPEEVKVELSGLQRDLYLIDPADLQLRVDASDVAEGWRTFELTERNVRRDEGLTVRALSPNVVRLTVSPAETNAAQSPPPKVP